MTPQTGGGGVLQGKKDAPAACTATQHGTVNAYSNYGCRCPEARRAKIRDWNQYLLRRMRGESLLIPSVGTIRRVQALHALGWRHGDIGERLGVSSSAVSQILGRDIVTARTARAIAALYDDLGDQPGPSALTAVRARSRGWLPPAWWDDDTIDDPTYQPPTTDREHWTDIDPVAVERACNGDDVPLSRAERIAAVQRLTNRGFSQLQTAARLGIHPRQVARDLAVPVKESAA